MQWEYLHIYYCWRTGKFIYEFPFPDTIQDLPSVEELAGCRFEIDVLNLMGKSGWECISVTEKHPGFQGLENYTYTNFYFKRPKKEV